jgi:hypothetical protein
MDGSAPDFTYLWCGLALLLLFATRYRQDSVQQHIVTNAFEEYAAPMLKMEALCSFKTLATMYQTTKCHKAKDHNLNFH